MLRISELDMIEFKEIAENFVYVSQRLFPDYEITKKLKILFVSKFGPILKDKGSKEEFQFLFKVGRESFKKDFTEIANTLDADTLAFLKSADISQFEYLLEKRIDKKTGKYLHYPVDSQYTQIQTEIEKELDSLQSELTNLPRDNFYKFLKPINRFRLLENRLYSWNLRILVNRLHYWNIQQGPHIVRIKNRKKGYLLPSEDFLLDHLFDYRKNELHDGIVDAEKNLDDLYKLLYLITPENPMYHIKKVVKRLEKWESKSIQLTKKDAFNLLEKLKSDEFEPNSKQKQIMEHDSFGSYQSKFIIPYKNEGFEPALDHLKSNKILPLEDFYRLCNVPSIYFRLLLQKSFKKACQKKGSLHEKLKGEKVDLAQFNSPDSDSPKSFQAFILIS